MVASLSAARPRVRVPVPLGEPFTQFRERPHPGRHVNVDPNGFRVSRGQGPWPPDPAATNVFLFGGSTTFNYGVRDDDTIASHLWAMLAAADLPEPPHVYNFGRGAYYSSQELVLFARLLTAGAVPDVAVFVDGLNDFFFHDDRPALTPMLEQWVAESSGPRETDVAELVRRLPVVDLVARHLPGPPAAMLGKPAPVVDPKTAIRRVIARYLANKRAIEGMAKRFGVRPVFVWQPVPTWKYDAARFAPGSGDFGGHERSRAGYARMAEERDRGAVGEHFVWCADIQEDADEPLYLDHVHYTPRMSRDLAACIFAGARAAGVW